MIHEFGDEDEEEEVVMDEEEEEDEEHRGYVAPSCRAAPAPCSRSLSLNDTIRSGALTDDFELDGDVAALDSMVHRLHLDVHAPPFTLLVAIDRRQQTENNQTLHF